ncbi:hypothetical protein Tco_0803575 [Tanacetum coccineum]|uniref:Reverse transcriptase domain-containing protein n=1 Tax=Tanacetum coccineum TaxID=301880 RepID=A0ABQ5A5P7_9ASTR
MPPKRTTTPMTDAAIKALIAQGVATALAENVMASKPKTMQDAIEIANDLMDQKIRTFAERQAENKRKLDNDNQAQQQPPKKQNVARAYSAGSSEKKEYAGTLPFAPENCRVIGKCNMRINPGMKLKEPTYQEVLDAFALTTYYLAFLITADVPVIYMHQFWATVTKHKASYRFKIKNKKFSVNVEVFKDILNICPRILGQEFDEPPTEEEALSFIRELGHSGEIMLHH